MRRHSLSPSFLLLQAAALRGPPRTPTFQYVVPALSGGFARARYPPASVGETSARLSVGSDSERAVIFPASYEASGYVSLVRHPTKSIAFFLPHPSPPSRESCSTGEISACMCIAGERDPLRCERAIGSRGRIRGKINLSPPFPARSLVI